MLLIVLTSQSSCLDFDRIVKTLNVLWPHMSKRSNCSVEIRYRAVCDPFAKTSCSVDVLIMISC